MKKCIILFFCAFLGFASLGALEFGLVLQDEAKFTQLGFYNNTTLIPWLSIPVNPKADFYLSGNFQFEYNYSKWNIIPDVGEFDFTYRFDDLTSIKVGRVPYFDATTLINMGLYDGVLADISLMDNPFRAAVFYTGLLNKKNAQVVLSASDLMDYVNDDIFFGSKRIIAAAEYGLEGFIGDKNTFTVGLLGQFDLRKGAENRLHSQYISLNYDLRQVDHLVMNFNGVLVFEESRADPFGAAAALAFDLSWYLPYDRTHKVLAAAQWTSGKTAAFIPYRSINDITVGEVFSPSLTGVIFTQLGYGARILPTLYGEFQANYFIRTDLGTAYDPDIDPASDSHLLGGEFVLNAVWSPLSDLSLVGEAGIFLPQMGGAFMEDAKVQWLVSLTLVLSF